MVRNKMAKILDYVDEMKDTEGDNVRMNNAKHFFIETLTKQDVEFIQRWEVATNKQATLEEMVTLLADRDDNEKNALNTVRFQNNIKTNHVEAKEEETEEEDLLLLETLLQELQEDLNNISHVEVQ